MAIFYIDSVKPNQASGEVREVYHALKREMGDVVEPIAMHALIPELLKTNWTLLREALLVDDQVKRKYKEAVASAVSSLNDCPYCVDAHTIMMIGLNDRQTAKAIAEQDLSLVRDPKSKQLLEWAYNTNYFHTQIIRNPPFGKEEAPEIIGTAVFFHYLNRMVTIFLGETILPFNIGFLKEFMKKMAAMMFSGVLKKEKPAGKSDNIPDLSSHGEPFFWSMGTPRINQALSNFYISTLKLGQEFVPEEVYDFIIGEIESWNGTEYMEQNILEKKISDLKTENQIMARALYQVSFTPYKITEKLIADLKSTYQLPDKALLGIFSWAAFRTATKIGKELGQPFR